MATVLPGDRGVVTSRLGFGMATLMREGSARRRRYVLEAAFDQGYKHFDVAPLYGFGRAEPDLGKFLSSVSSDTTVGTKFGLQPSRLAGALRGIQSPLRWTLARSSRLRHLARSYKGSARRPEVPDVEAVSVSVEASRRALGLDRLDLLLMHDMPWDEHWAHLWEHLSGTEHLGAVRALGIASMDAENTPYPAGLLTESNVLQVPARILARKSPMPADPFRIEFGLIAQHLSHFYRLLDGNMEVRRRAEHLVGTSLRTGPEVAAFLGSLNLAQRQNSILLVGSTQSQHLQEMWRGVEAQISTVKRNYVEISELLHPYFPSSDATTKKV